MPKVTKEEVKAICDAELPLVSILGAEIKSIGQGEASVSLAAQQKLLRPGGTISGPAMMAIADYAFYIALLSKIGLEPMAVTSNLTINFLRKPAAKELVAKAKVVKLGRRLAFGDVFIFSEGQEDAVAHATCTYALPE